MKRRTFEELHAAFERMLADSSLASGEVHHYYKLFQHASSYYALGDERKLIQDTIARPKWQSSLRYALRALLRKTSKAKLSSTVVIDDHRSIQSSEGLRSYYFERILSTLPSNEYSVIADRSDASALKPILGPNDLPLFGNRLLDRPARRVLNDLHAVLRRARMEYDKDPGFFDYLASAFTVFFEDFHRFHQLLKGQSVRRLLLTTHYHREGLIAAAKTLGIEVIEFQHGLIARQDLYYVYPKAVASFAERALFPDRLYVFGSYWRDLVLEGGEFRPEQVHVLGDYSLQSIGRQRYLDSAKENAILIGAQKNMPETYVAYTESLLRTLEARHPNWKVWVKLHPLEKVPEAYARLEKHPQCEVFGKGSELMPLLCKAKIQISVYSTTFYDALGLGVLNFSLQGCGSEDYARAMVREGVAFALEASDDPIERANDCDISGLLKVTEVYPPFKPSELPWSTRS